MYLECRTKRWGGEGWAEALLIKKNIYIIFLYLSLLSNILCAETIQNINSIQSKSLGVLRWCHLLRIQCSQYSSLGCCCGEIWSQAQELLNPKGAAKNKQTNKQTNKKPKNTSPYSPNDSLRYKIQVVLEKKLKTFMKNKTLYFAMHEVWMDRMKCHKSM